jgi:Flp pilus assembly protein TadG
MNSLRTRSRVSSTASANFASKLARFRRRARSERGSSLVEFALVLPLLMVVATGIFTFGVALNQYLTLTNATTIGAQLLAVSRGNSSTPCTNAINAIYSASPGLARASLNFTFTFTNGSTNIGNFSTAATCDTAAAGTSSPFVQGASVQLFATYNACSLAGYGFNFTPTGCSFTANITEIIQ